ncbi:MAG TPA: hypothetical protein VKX41_16930 [Alloacidobacterium sp.]|jgi:hypothetical protein|nr:hypothetical protein [Alloacidobacterium sp.]
MKYKSFFSAVISTSLAIVLLSVGRAQATPQPGAGQQERPAIGTEMMSHQRAMDIVLARLQADFQAVVSSKDGNGAVHDKAAVKTYKGDLAALRVITSQHKQFAADYERWCSQSFSTDYEHWCGPEVKQNAMAEHQQRMKRLLFDLSDTLDRYITEDNHSIEGGPNKIQDALDAHRDALNEFSEVIKDHEGAISQMMTQDDESIPELPPSSSVLLPPPEAR